MSKKKDKEKIEDEISRLCDTSPETSQAPEATTGLQDFLQDFLRIQTSQHGDLMRSMAASSQANIQAVVTAVKETAGPPQLPAPQPPAPQPPAPTPVVPAPMIPQPPVPRGLFSYEPDEEDPEYSSDEEYDFHGWDLPPSGQQSYADSASAPSTSQAPPAAEASQDADPLLVAEGLFNEYDQMPNWRGAPEIFTWLAGIVDKEVPGASLKVINETFVPELKFQHLFAAPVLPQAITDRLAAAPKSMAKVPKMVNDTLIRAVCISVYS